MLSLSRPDSQKSDSPKKSSREVFFPVPEGTEENPRPLAAIGARGLLVVVVVDEGLRETLKIIQVAANRIPLSVCPVIDIEAVKSLKRKNSIRSSSSLIVIMIDDSMIAANRICLSVCLVIDIAAVKSFKRMNRMR